MELREIVRSLESTLCEGASVNDPNNICNCSGNGCNGLNGC